MLVFPVFLKRRLVAAPLPLTQGTLKQPNGGTRAPVTNDLVLTGGLAIPDTRSAKGARTPVPFLVTLSDVLVSFLVTSLGVSQRSGEGVMRRNGCSKGCCGESVSSLPP